MNLYEEIGSIANGFGSGWESFVIFRDENGIEYLLFADEFDTSAITQDGTISLTEADAAGNMLIKDIICFANGVLIKTPKGDSLVEELKVGDQVLTTDGREVPICWLGSSKVVARVSQQNPKLFPVVISAGSLGYHTPKRDLRVSRQHRILLRSNLAHAPHGQLEVLVPAIKLLDVPGVYIDDSFQDVTYFHILTDDHELVTADGAVCETLYLGEQAIDFLSEGDRKEIENLGMIHARQFETARPIVDHRNARELVGAIMEQDRPLVE